MDVSSKRKESQSSSSSEKKQRLLVHEGTKTAAIRARDGSELPVRLGRWCATIASSPDISGRIALRDRDPRFTGQERI